MLSLYKHIQSYIWVWALAFMPLSSLAQTTGGGNTMDFSGNQQYVSLNQSFGTISFPLTITYWFKAGSFSASPYTYIFSSHNQSGAYRGVLALMDNNFLGLRCGNGTNRSPSGRFGWSASPTFTPGQWYHIALVATSGTQAQFYVNGNPVTTTQGTGTATRTLSSNNSNGRIAANTAGNNITYADGQLDELSFWDIGLSQTQIRDQMCHTLTGNEPGLLAYWNFDTLSGNTLPNAVANAPSGTIVNGPVLAASSAPVGDRSVHNNHVPGALATGVTNTNDTVTANPTTTGQPGTHLYFIDQSPTSTTGINVPGSVNGYWGVFNANASQSYVVDVGGYGGGTGTAPNASLQLSERPDNTVPLWTQTTHRNNPNYVSPGHSSHKQFIISYFGCPSLNLLPDTLFGCDNLFTAVDSTYTNYSWSTGSNTYESGVISTSGTLWVQFSDTGGCVYRDTAYVDIINTNTLPNLSVDTSVCSVPFVLDLSQGNATAYEWFDGDTSPIKSFFSSGSYPFEVFYGNGCSRVDTLNLTIDIPATDLVSSSSFEFCNGDSVSVSLANANFFNIIWSNGETGTSSYYSDAGIGWVQAENSLGCVVTDTFTLTTLPGVGSAPFADMFKCSDEDLIIVRPPDVEIIWPNGSTGSSFTITAPGTYTTTIYNNCDSLTSSFNVEEISCQCLVFVPDAFTPNGDGKNDEWGPVFNCDFHSYSLEVYARNGQLIFSSDNPDEKWDAYYRGSKMANGVYVYRITYTSAGKLEEKYGYISLLP